MRPWLQKISLTYFSCKLGQREPIVMQLKLDMSRYPLNVYAKFQIKIQKHIEKNCAKRGRTDGHCHGIIRPFFKRAYKNDQKQFDG